MTAQAAASAEPAPPASPAGAASTRDLLTAEELDMLSQAAAAALRLVLRLEAQATGAEPVGSAPGSGAAADEVEPVPPGPPPPRVVADLTLAFSRANRALRMCIALKARLRQEAQAAADARRGQGPDETRLRVTFVDGATGREIPEMGLTVPPNLPPLEPIPGATRPAPAAPPPPPARPVRDTSATRADLAAALRRIAKGAQTPGELSPRDEREAIERLTREMTERLETEDDLDEVLSRPVSEIVAMICRDLGFFLDWESLAQDDWAKAEIASGRAGAPLKPFSSPACGGGGPQPVLSDAAGGVEGQLEEGAHPPPPPHAPSVPPLRAAPPPP